MLQMPQWIAPLVVRTITVVLVIVVVAVVVVVLEVGADVGASDGEGKSFQFSDSTCKVMDVWRTVTVAVIVVSVVDETVMVVVDGAVTRYKQAPEIRKGPEVAASPGAGSIAARFFFTAGLLVATTPFIEYEVMIVTAISVVVLWSIFSPGEWVDILKTHTVAGMVTWGPSRGVAVIKKI
jgi:hypothetical protein